MPFIFGKEDRTVGALVQAVRASLTLLVNPVFAVRTFPLLRRLRRHFIYASGSDSLMQFYVTGVVS